VDLGDSPQQNSTGFAIYRIWTRAVLVYDMVEFMDQTNDIDKPNEKEVKTRTKRPCKNPDPRLKLGGAPLGNHNARKHGLKSAQNLVEFYGRLSLDQNLPIVKQRNHWLERVIEDKGGREHLSELQLTDYERLADLWLILAGATRAVMTLLPSSSLINQQKRSFHPVIVELFRMSDSFGRQCYQAGIHRVPKPTPSLEEYLASKYGDKEDNAQ
jgi:hypothetical protein